MTERSIDQFSLRWDNFHINMKSEFHSLLESEDLVDVTLATEGQFTQAHKLVLSACSPYFKELFRLNPCKHPIVILKDVTYSELRQLLHFIYKGEVNVNQQDLPAFLKTAELLQVKGLTGNDPEKTKHPLPPSTSNSMKLKYDREDTITNRCLLKRPRVGCTPEIPPPVLSSSQTSVSSSSNVHVKKKGVLPEIETTDSFTERDVINLEDEDSLEEDVDLKPTHEELVKVLQGRMKTEPTENQDDLCNTLKPPSPSGSREPSLLSGLREMPATDSGQDDKMREMIEDWCATAERESLQCEMCPRRFQSKYNLQIHVSNEHGNDRGPFCCQVCGRKAKNRNSLRVHMFIYHKDSPNRLNMQS